jgi:death on curing protein
MFWLSAADIYTINEEVVGHEPIVIDRRLLTAAAQRPFQRMFGHDAYPTLVDKAAALLHSLAHDHMFVDGNKRTAQEAVRRFLEANGAQIHWTNEQAYDLTLAIAKGQHNANQVAEWMQQHITFREED